MMTVWVPDNEFQHYATFLISKYLSFLSLALQEMFLGSAERRASGIENEGAMKAKQLCAI